jgi:transmembrane sensor
MSNIVDFPTQERRFDEASLWIARLDRGLTDQEQKDLQQWLQQDTENQQVLMKLARLWDKMDRLMLLSDVFHVAKTRKKIPLYQYAAACFLMLTLGLGAWLFHTGSINESSESFYQTALGEQKQLTLSDGSTLVLNTDSQVKVVYSKKQRLIFLNRGEIHIEVAHAPERPLSVIAGSKVVQAVGTAFDVQVVGPEKVRLWVTEGRVLVTERQLDNIVPLQKIEELSADVVAVSKGEKMILTPASKKVERIEESDMAAQLGWRQGNIVFRGETLGEAVLEFSRYSDKKFVISDESLQNVRVAGVFKIGDTERLLNTLKNNFSIEYQYGEDNQIYLSSQR